MLTKNFYIHLAATFTGQAATFKNGYGQTYTDSQASWSSARFSLSYINTMTKAPTSNGVVFGDGDKAPTEDDYWLSGNIITTLSGSGTVRKTKDDAGMTVTSSFLLTNSGTSDVTIKEVGYCSAYNSGALLDRTVLDEPLTIPAGGIGQVTYTIRMNYPTA